MDAKQVPKVVAVQIGLHLPLFDLLKETDESYLHRVIRVGDPLRPAAQGLAPQARVNAAESDAKARPPPRCRLPSAGDKTA